MKRYDTVYFATSKIPLEPFDSASSDIEMIVDLHSWCQDDDLFDIIFDLIENSTFREMYQIVK